MSHNRFSCPKLIRFFRLFRTHHNMNLVPIVNECYGRNFGCFTVFSISTTRVFLWGRCFYFWNNNIFWHAKSYFFRIRLAWEKVPSCWKRTCAQKRFCNPWFWWEQYLHNQGNHTYGVRFSITPE